MSTASEIIKRVMVEDFGVEPGEFTEAGNIFSDFGFDSLDGVELILAVEEAADVDVPDEVIDRTHMTVAELSTVIDGLLTSKAN